MRTLTATLLAAQQDASSVPYVKVEAVNKFAGAVRLDWERVYEGSEDDTCHSLTMAGDGSMIRTRIGLLADSRKLYRQRVTDPDTGSDFSSWVYAGLYNCLDVASVSCGSEVLVFAITSALELRYIMSTDSGETWGTPQLIDYVPAGAVNGITAASKPNGDCALFFCIGETLYEKRRLGGTWQAKSAWDKTTGALSGVAAVFGDDWELAVAGKDTDGNFRLWSLIFGDGGTVPAGTWDDLREIAASPADGDYEFRSVFMDIPDVRRLFYLEVFSGNEAYSRPFRTQTLPGASYAGNLWIEPVPFDFQCGYGMAMAHHGDHCWLSVPDGVWRACLEEKRIDLSEDVVYLGQDIRSGADSLIVHLRNDKGQFASLPEPAGTGCRLDISPGYLTGAGDECSTGQSYTLEACEYVSEDGNARLFLYGYGGWERVKNWTAGWQFRFNGTGDEACVRQILECILARAGIQLAIVSQSATVSSFYPDFTVYPGSSGTAVIAKLLSFVPDTIFIEGDMAYLIDLSVPGSPVYSYGRSHPVIEGKYRTASWKVNRVTVEGYDSSSGAKILKDSFAWDQITAQQARNERSEDRNIGSIADASDRGTTFLKNAAMESVNGTIDIPVNCGQQLFDIIDITDERAGLSAAEKRVMKISLIYDPERGRYRQILSLGAV